MNITETSIGGLYVASTTPFRDARGAFARFFCADELKDVLGARSILQINHSRTSAAGAVRGMHFQHPPHAEMKMVRCLKGRVWDVAVDVRQGSPTFLKHYAQELTPDNALMMVIPEGFAHGFQVLENESELLYLHTAFYEKTAEGGLRYDDPALNINWPLDAKDLSARDLAHPLLTPQFEGLTIKEPHA